MKIRTGFVSNSSSSSFIVAAKKGKTKVKLELEVDLADYLDGDPITTVEELIRFYKDEFDYDATDLDNDADFKASKKAIQSGQVVYRGSFSDQSDNNLERFLCEQGIPENTKNINIIQGGGGY